MRLVFVHGWGFAAPFWDDVAAELNDIPQARAELGFLGGKPDLPELTPHDILVGHSLGFLWGLSQQHAWNGAIAINGFARFTGGEGEAVPPAQLRAMGAGLRRDPQKTLAAFYRNLGLENVPAFFESTRLAEGLGFLENAVLPPSLPRTLVLAARNDLLVPESASAYLGEAASADVIWHDRGGHLLPRTASAWCVAQIRTFLA